MPMPYVGKYWIDQQIYIGTIINILNYDGYLEI